MSGMFDLIVRQRPAAPATSAGDKPANPPKLAQTDLFPRACALIIDLEGGAKVTNDPDDPGGVTKYGISKKFNPDVDVANLTKEQAMAIYRKKYWDANRCGEMPWPLALVVFDCAVNPARQNAARYLQMALRITADGVIGPKTMAAVAAADPVAVAQEIQAQRIMSYVAVPGWGKYGLGWTRRAFKVMAQAVS